MRMRVGYLFEWVQMSNVPAGVGTDEWRTCLSGYR